MKQIYATALGDKKIRMMGLSDSERISMTGSAVFTAQCTLGIPYNVRLSVCLSVRLYSNVGDL